LLAITNKQVIIVLSKVQTIIAVVVLLCLLLCGYYYGENQYKKGYDAGYTACAESMSVPIIVEKPDTVQASTAVATTTQTVVRPKQSTDKASVVVKTEKPTIVATVNGKKYDFKPQSEVLDTTVKTTGVINVRIPERRWVVGVGYSKDKSVGYMLKAPIGKSAVGLWVAGSGKKNVMGGLSVSF
jgi:hypothetical protein